MNHTAPWAISKPNPSHTAPCALIDPGAQYLAEIQPMEPVMSNTIGLGRPGREVKAEITRDLTTADLVALANDRGVRPPALKRLTDMHHNIARLIAQGETGYAIALATGYSESRISILKGDPAFRELIARYEKEIGAFQSEWTEAVQAKMAAINLDFLEMLHEKGLDGEMDVRQIQDTVRMTLDRSGFGPASKSQNTNVNLDLAGQLERGRLMEDEIKARVPEAKAAKTIEVPFERRNDE